MVYLYLSARVLLSLLLFYWLCVGGRAGAGGGCARGPAVLAGVSVMLAGGKATFVEYPAMLARSIGWRQEFGMNRTNMFGWNAFLTRVLPPDDQMAILLLTLLTSAVTLLLAVLVWRKQPDLDDGSRPALALAAATILASPHMHQHDLAILLL